MGCSTAKEEKGSKRRRQITSIAEWVQCFGVFMAVVASKSPDRTIDLLGYQSIIVEASREYEGETWLGYDRRFRQMAAAKLGCKWATVDPTLWNMAFTGHARVLSGGGVKESKRHNACWVSLWFQPPWGGIM